MENRENQNIKNTKNHKKAAPEIKIKNMGVDIDKNEYREIVLSNSARPEAAFYDRYR
ncbi:MAG: hypothetical protein KHX03_06465 [Clostridium sp.]|nr:hypothetical protein [Clostridium sp.]